MANLPEIINTPIELDINGVKIQAKRAGFKEIAALEEFRAKAKTECLESANTKVLPYALYLCIKNVYPETTEDYINELVSPIYIMENPERMENIMIALGFMLPPKAKTEEKK